MFEFVLLLHDLIDIVLVVEVTAEATDLILVLLDAGLLLFEFLPELADSLVLLHPISRMPLLFPLLLFLHNFVHLRRQLFQLVFQLCVLVHQFVTPE